VNLTPVADEGSGAGDRDAVNASAAAGYGRDADIVPAAADSAVETVKGRVMAVISSDGPGFGTSSTPLVPIAIVLVVIGAVVAGIYSKRE